MTCREALEAGVRRLEAAGVPDAEWDAFCLWERASGQSRAAYLTHRGEAAETAWLEAFRCLTDLREKRVPLQHILGEAWFMGLPFYVNEAVLIPRPETELLAERVLRDWSGRKTVEAVHGGGRPAAAGNAGTQGLRLLDMCTGSGCLAVSLAVLGHFDRVAAADISPEALAVARRNAERNGAAVDFFQGDLFGGLPAGSTYQVLVSNPPYIPTGQLEALMPEVREHDPQLALDGGADGLDFYRRLAREAVPFLAPGAWVYWEIGWDQGPAVSRILEEAGYRRVQVLPDLAGKDRMVTGEWIC